MSQHDLNIANQGFPATRADLNNALAALASNSSGTSEPSTTYANQLWYDTSNDLLKFRNEADSAWITLAYMNQTTSEWEIRSGVVQAVDSDGILFKTDEGTTRATLGDDGDWTFTGTVASANISDGTDTVATSYVVNGSAKAWVNFNGTGTIAVRDSFNVASLTDDGTGDFSVNFTSSLSTSTYGQYGSAGGTSGVNGDESFIAFSTSAGGTASQSNQLRCRRGSGNHTGSLDSILVTYLAHGDLA
jgi:hypothetical protein